MAAGASKLSLENLVFSGVGCERILRRKMTVSARVILGKGGWQHLELFLVKPVVRRESETLLKWNNS